MTLNTYAPPETNHQLESRMPEIGLFGSEGGAPTFGVPTPIIAQALYLFSFSAF
jgi:hypothetical protein